MRGDLQMSSKCLNSPLLVSLLLSLFVLFLPTIVCADWINLSGAENTRNIAEISIEKDRVRIQLEVFVEDLMIFEELIPEDFFSQPLPGRPGLEQRQKLFAENLLQVVTDQGVKLPVTFDLIEPRLRIERPSPFAGMISPYTRQPIPGPPEDKRVLYAELSYPFNKRPESLTFIPPLDERGITRAPLGFICSHLGVTVVDFRVLSGSHTLHLDWDDP